MQVNQKDVEALKTKMEKAPEIEKSKRLMTKQDAVRELQPAIEMMQAKGYTLEQIVDFMSKESNVKLSVATLKSYLQRLRKGQLEIPARSKRVRR